MEKTVFTIFADGKRYLTIRTTEKRIKSKALRLHYREGGASEIKVLNENKQTIFTI